MLHALQAYLQKLPTRIGILTAIMFQVVFSLIWMTGYSGVNERLDGLTVAIVNEDAGAGREAVRQLQATLPFQVVTPASLDQAQEALNSRQVQMVLHIPAHFTESLQSPGKRAEIAYTINESNPALIKSMMQSASAGITAALGREASAAGTEAVLVQAGVPAEQAQGTAAALVSKVQAATEFTNPVQGMNNQMVPMMMVLASYVGAMIMGMNLQQATAMLTGHSRWSRFGARVIINVGAAVLTAGIGSSLVLLLGGQAAAGFLKLWLFQSLFLLTFMFFSQMFLIVFGMAGMLFNITMLSLQLVSSGAMVPRELLSPLYHGISEFLPATYAVEGGMNLLFGGPGAGGAALALTAIAAVCAAVGLLAVGLRRERQGAAVPGAPAAAGAAASTN